MSSMFKLTALAALLQFVSAQLNCSDYSFQNNFNNKTAWKQDFERTSRTSRTYLFFFSREQLSK